MARHWRMEHADGREWKWSELTDLVRAAYDERPELDGCGAEVEIAYGSDSGRELVLIDSYDRAWQLHTDDMRMVRHG